MWVLSLTVSQSERRKKSSLIPYSWSLKLWIGFDKAGCWLRHRVGVRGSPSVVIGVGLQRTGLGGGMHRRLRSLNFAESSSKTLRTPKGAGSMVQTLRDSRQTRQVFTGRGFVALETTGLVGFFTSNGRIVPSGVSPMLRHMGSKA